MERAPKTSPTASGLRCMCEEEIKEEMWIPDYLDYGERTAWSALRFDRNFVGEPKKVRKIMQQHTDSARSPIILHLVAALKEL